MKISKTNRLYKNIRVAFNTSKLVLRWGIGSFGWKPIESYTGSNPSLLDQIWEPLLKARSQDSVRSVLSQWKTVRVWLMKLLGSTPKERAKLISAPPKGTRNWIRSLLKTWLSDMPSIDRRAWMTALFSTRAVTLSGLPDYDVITQDSTRLTPSYKSKVKNFWRKLRVNKTKSVTRRVRWSNWHLTSKQGPNGLALTTLARDYKSLPEKLKKSLSVLGGPKYDKAIKTMDTIMPWLEGSEIPTDIGKIRRVSSFGDLEGKTRVVAVLDYFSQSILKPLHGWLFRILKRIPQDFTFHQGGFLEKTKDWEEFYSCDLTAATDRFPIKVISEVLLGIFPQEYVSAWEDIMVGYPFEIPGGSSVSYRRGNPMGAYSSWASFTLAHHFVMFMCCEDLGIEWRTSKYALLGDDILIGDHKLYQRYRKYISDLDISVSEPKTHESKDLLEFAKRWVYQGGEITPFPIPAMLEARNYNYLAALLSQERERGYQVDIPSSVKSWFFIKDIHYQTISNNTLAPRRRGHYTRLGELAVISENLIHMFRQKISWNEGFKIIFKDLNLTIEDFMDDHWISSFWGLFLRDLWLKSSDSHMIGQMKYHEDRSTDFDPQLVWQRLMMENFMEVSELTDDGVLDVKLVPWVSLAGQLTMTSDDSYFTITQLLKGDLSQTEGWEAVRRLVLPDLGTVFRERKYNVIRVLAGRLSRDLMEIFRGQRKLVKITSASALLNFDNDIKYGKDAGRELVNPLSPDILSDTWRELL